VQKEPSLIEDKPIAATQNNLLCFSTNSNSVKPKGEQLSELKKQDSITEEK
jgi:hypothetical protein